jgi:hypothetical protein
MRPSLALRAIPRHPSHLSGFRKKYRRSPVLYLGLVFVLGYPFVSSGSRELLLSNIAPGLREVARISSGESSAIERVRGQYAQATKEGIEEWYYIGRLPVPALSLLLSPFGKGSKE